MDLDDFSEYYDSARRGLLVCPALPGLYHCWLTFKVFLAEPDRRFRITLDLPLLSFTCPSEFRRQSPLSFLIKSY